MYLLPSIIDTNTLSKLKYKICNFDLMLKIQSELKCFMTLLTSV